MTDGGHWHEVELTSAQWDAYLDVVESVTEPARRWVQVREPEVTSCSRCGGGIVVQRTRWVLAEGGSKAPQNKRAGLLRMCGLCRKLACERRR